MTAYAAAQSIRWERATAYEPDSGYDVQVDYLYDNKATDTFISKRK
jgi:hypothetical protein